ncbi:MAG: CopG family transcriptional regulator [Geodermatophilaceae bacterium]|nr:CopG family transcriptional regulator [Geodermatophilaceae bacterium]
MYSDVVQRTQIYLDDEVSDLLAEMSARTGASRSELIRRAVRAQYHGESPEGRLGALRASAGMWRDRSGTGAEYVEELRTGLDDRLAQVRLK